MNTINKLEIDNRRPISPKFEKPILFASIGINIKENKIEREY